MPTAALTDPHTTDPLAPVVVRFGALGDMVLLTVLLQALHQRHGRPAHLLSSGAWTPELLAADPAVGELRLVSSRRRPYLLTPSQWAARRWLAQHRGPVYLCDPDPHAERLLQRAGLPDQQVLRAWQHRPAGEVHWADWWLQIAALDPPGLARRPTETPLVPTRGQPRLHLPPSWQADGEAWLRGLGLAGRPLLLLQPGNKKTHRRGRLATAYYDKHWPPAHWAEVIRRLLAELPGAAALVCGSSREAGLAQEVVDAVGPLPAGRSVHNLAAQQLSLRRLMVLAARAHSMVSIDTGPAHVAAAMDCPLVVLYGSAGWGQWLPRAPGGQVLPLGARHRDLNAKAMDLTPDQVVNTWRQLRFRPA